MFVARACAVLASFVLTLYAGVTVMAYAGVLLVLAVQDTAVVLSSPEPGYQMSVASAAEPQYAPVMAAMVVIAFVELEVEVEHSFDDAVVESAFEAGVEFDIESQLEPELEYEFEAESETGNKTDHEYKLELECLVA